MNNQNRLIKIQYCGISDMKGCVIIKIIELDISKYICHLIQLI